MYDYLVVGQGLAGSLLTHFLLREKKKILLIDKPSLSASSRVASGIYNPITGKRLALSWKPDIIIPFAEKIYTELEEQFGEKFLFRKKILRIFQDENELNIWEKKSKLEEFSHWGKNYSEEISFAKTEYGAIEIDGGWLDTGKFISLMRKHFSEEKILLEEKFSFDELSLEENSVRWKNYSAKKIIFCDGYRILENPFFSELPYQPSKGEVLLFRAPELPEEKILMGNKIHIVPHGEEIFLAGSTYAWEKLNDEASAEGREYLEQKLREFLSVDFEITGQAAGVRLSVTDQRPIVGIKKDFPQIGIINGFGAKGVMYAPYCAEKLVRYLEHGEPVEKEISMERFNAR